MSMGAKDKARGMRTEREVYRKLKGRVRGVAKSTQQEDEQLNIDLWVGNVPVSVKDQTKGALKSGNLCFELRAQNRYTGVWRESWYHTGAETVSIIKVGDTYYWLTNVLLKNYVKLHGWERVAGLSGKVRREQEECGHMHGNVEVGLLSIRTLLAEGIMQELDWENLYEFL